MSYVLMPLMLGFLFGPAIPLYMISEEVRPVWAVILVNLVLLSVIVAATWHGVQKMNAAKRAVEPTRQWERLHADRIDIGFADGTVRSLPLHAADLRCEYVSGGRMPIDQYVLAATDHEGTPVKVLTVNTPRWNPLSGYMTMPVRQPDHVLAAIANAAERSPHPTGRQTATALRGFIGTRVTTNGWEHG